MSIDTVMYILSPEKNHVILSLDTVIHALSLDTVTDIPSQTLTA